MHRPLTLALRYHPRQIGASSAAAARRALPYYQTSPPGTRGGLFVLTTSAQVPPGARAAMPTSTAAAWPAAASKPIRRSSRRRGFQRAAARHKGLGDHRRARHCRRRGLDGLAGEMRRRPCSSPSRRRSAWGDASALTAAVTDEPKRRCRDTRASLPPVRAARRPSPNPRIHGVRSRPVPPLSLLRTRPCPQTRRTPAADL